MIISYIRKTFGVVKRMEFFKTLKINDYVILIHLGDGSVIVVGVYLLQIEIDCHEIAFY